MYKSRISSVAKNFKSLVIEVYKFYIFKKVLTGSIWSIYGSHKIIDNIGTIFSEDI
jgi:hypothetical protein